MILKHKEKLMSQNEWDSYYISLCDTVAMKSRCKSRKIGAVIVKDNCILSTGYNGPPRGFPHCLTQRLESDPLIYEYMKSIALDEMDECPRHLMGFKSGQGLDFCPAAHAETNAIVQAARIGVSVRGARIYLNAEMPCKACLGLIINSGIEEVISLKAQAYDSISQLMINLELIKVRVYEGVVL